MYICVAGRGQQISNTHDTYLISAESAVEADDWVAAIRRVMHEVWLPSFLCLFNGSVFVCSHMVEVCLAVVWRRQWQWRCDLEEDISPSFCTAACPSCGYKVCSLYVGSVTCHWYYAGLREVGIFRLPGQASRVQDLKELYDQGQFVNIVGSFFLVEN